MHKEWNFRSSSLYVNHGVNFRYVLQKCSRHGVTEHTEIENGGIVCRACCKEREKPRKATHAQITSIFYD